MTEEETSGDEEYPTIPEADSNVPEWIHDVYDKAQQEQQEADNEGTTDGNGNIQ